MSVLQIRRGNRDNLGISLLICRNIHCDPSLELSGQDSSNDGSQHMFSFNTKKLSLNYPCHPFLSGTLLFDFPLTSLANETLPKMMSPLK